MNTSKDSGGNLVDVKFKAAYKMTVNFGLKIKLKIGLYVMIFNLRWRVFPILFFSQ